MREKTGTAAPASQAPDWRAIANDLAIALNLRRYRQPEYPIGSWRRPGHVVIAEEREREDAALARFNAVESSLQRADPRPGGNPCPDCRYPASNAHYPDCETFNAWSTRLTHPGAVPGVAATPTVPVLHEEDR